METYLIEQVMQILHISKRTVYNHIRIGRFQTKRVGVSQRITADSVKREQRRQALLERDRV